ncbi:MAG: ADP-ribose pyrophosphatase [Rhodospirillales bacterium]|nr:ADP-ribose pyrophosphatase [Rhodospirillales bacterium]
MSREYPPLPMVGLLAIVRRGDRFLLVRRAKEPNKGRWGFPGGIQELGETVVDGARRELAEETGLAAAAGQAITALDAMDRDDAGRIRYHYTLIVVAMRDVTGEPVAGDDAAEVGWFGLADLETLPVIAAVGPLMRQLLGQAAALGIGPT